MYSERYCVPGMQVNEKLEPWDQPKYLLVRPKHAGPVRFHFKSHFIKGLI